MPNSTMGNRITKKLSRFIHMNGGKNELNLFTNEEKMVNNPHNKVYKCRIPFTATDTHQRVHGYAM